MIIGLLGFNFENANKGCEALTYSFIDIINRLVEGEKKIIYFSNDDLIGNVPKYYPNTTFELVRIRLKDPHFSFIKKMKTCDIIFDITYGDNFSDIYLPEFALKTTLIKNLVTMIGVPLVLLPQTYGPFSSKLISLLAARAISKAKRVYSRDQLSIDCINNLTHKDVMLTTDLAFLLPYAKKETVSKKRKLGINVSGLLWKGGFQENNQFGLTVDYRKYVREIIDGFKDEFEIHLIPHVIETVPHSLDGDLFIIDELAKDYKQCIKAPAFRDAIEAKSYIANMDVFIGARMHSTVAAFSSGVAVIPFSYSRKFEGLYGNLGYEYIVHGCTDTTDDAIRKTSSWISEYTILKKSVERCQSVLDKQLGGFISDLKEILKE